MSRVKSTCTEKGYNAATGTMLPCPNCDSKDVDATFSYGRTTGGRIIYQAGCMSCSMIGPDATNAMDAAAKWNNLPRRSPLRSETRTTTPDEHTAMLLAAISTAAISNTRETFEKNRLPITSPWHTAAYGDVLAAVLREIEWRERTESIIEECASLVESRGGTGSYAESMAAHRILTSAAEALRALKGKGHVAR